MWPFQRKTVREPDPPTPEARTSRAYEKLTESESHTFRDGECPDCGSTKILEGPSGGLSTNYACGDETCGSRFNEMGPFGVQRISDAGRVRSIQ